MGFRNAVIARKVEEYIVPNEMQPGTKLNVGILFGAAHSGIENNIQNRWLRNTTISAYEKFGYPGTSKDDLNRIRRINYKNGRYIGEELSLNLF